MPDTRKIIIDTAVMIGIALLLAVLGPFGTFALPFAARLTYWVMLGLAGYWLYRPAMAWASRMAPRLDLPEAALWAGACALVSVPMSAVVWSVNLLGTPARWPSLGAAFEHYLYVLVVAGAVCAIFWFFGERRKVAIEPSPGPVPVAVGPGPSPAPPGPAFLDRLPPHLGRTLLALEMEDHYVRAHTPAGSALILMRMRDAIAELAGIEGMQVHRSWWVARNAVTGTRRDGRNMRLVLANGVEAPVARNSVEALQQTGWI